MIDGNDDYSRRFQELRPFLVNDEGLRYADFIKTLTPNYTRLYLDIALGYFALIVTFAFVRAVPVEMDYGPLFEVSAFMKEQLQVGDPEANRDCTSKHSK